MAIIHQLDKRTGITYVYESKSYWDKDKKQSRSKRTLLGKLDPDTGNILPTDGRGKKRGFSKHEIPKQANLSPESINELCLLLNDNFHYDHEVFCPVFLPETVKQTLKPEQQPLFALIANVMSMYMSVSEKDVVFEPGRILYGKHRSAKPSDLTEADYCLLKSLNFSQLPSAIRAKICDLLWTIRSDYPSARIALDTYIDLYTKCFDQDNWPEYIEMMDRILCISQRINDQKSKKQALEMLRVQALELNGEDTDCLSVSMLKRLIHQQYGAPEEYLFILDKIIQNIHSTQTKVESAFALKKECYKWQKPENSSILNLDLSLAQYYETKATSLMESVDTQTSNFSAISQIEMLLKKTVRIYSGNKDYAEQLLQTESKLRQVQKLLPNTLQSFIVPNNHQSEINQFLDECFQGLSFEECVIRLTQLFRLDTKEETEKKLATDVHTTPFLSIAGKQIIGSDGRTVCNLKSYYEIDPEKESDEFQKLLYHRAAEDQGMTGLLILEPAIKTLSRMYDISENSFDFLTHNNGLIPSGRERIFSLAFSLAFTGDLYTASHILIPQTEHLFRCLAQELGGKTIRTYKDGVDDMLLLNDIFNLPEMIDSCTEDVLFTFRGLLIEHAGSNLRNEFSHGMIDDNQQNSILAYFVCALLKYLVNASPECLRLYRDNDKLHMLKQLP